MTWKGISPRADSDAGCTIGMSLVVQIVGPATVEGAIQGHSPEARAAYKRRVAENKRVRREATLQREDDDRVA